MRAALGCVALAALLLLGCTHTTESPESRPTPPAVGAEAAIAFANHGGIRNWRALDDSTVWIEDQFGHHYLAKLVTPSWNLAYAETIGFVTEPGGSFDRHSAILVKGITYPVASLIRTADGQKNGASAGTTSPSASAASAP